jgi:hypothetical protein
MGNSRRRVARVAPGTAYTAGADLATITPAFNCIMAIEICTSAAGVVLKRVNSVNMEMNEGVPIAATQPHTLYTMCSPSDPVTLRFSVDATIYQLYVDEIDTDV